MTTLWRVRFATVIGVAVLSACSLLPQPAHHVETETPIYDPTMFARVRVLSSENNQPYTVFRSGGCYQALSGFDGIRVDDGMVGSFRYATRSVVIGMPPSPRPWMRVEGLTGKRLIREYVVPAGQPITYSMGWIVYSGQYGTTRRCVASSMVLTPDAGRDYDVFLTRQGRQCEIEARQIDGQGLDESVHMNVALECRVNKE
ncbi:conserved hypothetical protein [Paraburkholderia piptadeniae]|uniref:Lipoprotein n=1 Tax=Paraburkholderia piptadeniae TaxID=1701573 RepID=A0A1N7S3Q4_9BURK|nr:hypothetical protein [Paraburkholderia piptadeniae]SIT41612.1 conserved hypothetical protein [Paraburkholderia piptadeniae]